MRVLSSDESLSDSVRRVQPALDFVESEVTATVEQSGGEYRKPTTDEIGDLEAALRDVLGRGIRIRATSSPTQP